MKAEVLQSKLVQARGHAAVGLELKPSLANNIVFREPGGPGRRGLATQTESRNHQGEP